MKKVLPLLSFVLISNSAFATPIDGSLSGINAVSTNQALNNQSAIGTVNQSPVGGINSNYQINNSQATDYGFAPGIYCRGANFSIGGYGSGSNSNAYNFNSFGSNYGVIALLNIPISGDANKSCRALAREIVKQRQLDTSYNLIKVCSALKRENISLNYEIFPDFKVCDAVTINTSAPISNLGNNPFTSKDNATVTVPVR
jgi:hypothetical protein